MIWYDGTQVQGLVVMAVIKPRRLSGSFPSTAAMVPLAASLPSSLPPQPINDPSHAIARATDLCGEAPTVAILAGILLLSLSPRANVQLFDCITYTHSLARSAAITVGKVQPSVVNYFSL